MPLSINGPFLTERAIYLHFQLPIADSSYWQLLGSAITQNHLLRSLVAPRLVATCRLTPGSHRIAAARSLSLAATMGMIHRVHGHTTHLRSQPFPTRSAGFAQRHVLVFQISDLPNCSPANQRHSPDFT